MTHNFRPITKAEARGDSAAMSLGELRSLADWGEGILTVARLAATRPAKPISDALIQDAYVATREDWGGVTIDLRAGQAVSRSSGYAVTTGTVRVKLDPDAPRPVFGARLWGAARRIPRGQYLGVFNDPETGRIDIDSVFLTDSRDEAIAVGVARHSTGGIYDFATGDGVWVPHLAESE